MKSRIGFTELSTFSTGHSAALMALQNGFVEIQEGRADLFLIGGADSYMDADTLEWLDETEQLHSEENTWGFIPGEAAGFALLASERAAQRFGLSPLLRVVAAATSIETNLIRTDTVCTGKGLTASVKQTLRALPAEEKVHHTICDMNGERYRADELAFTITRTSNHFVDATNFLSPADCWGDVGAASGGLFLNLAAAAKRKNYGQGPNTLLWTSSDSGERSAALIAGGA
jgi:3-oxoacyl-[acyl-carrier-protein] synthase-1